LLLAAGSWIGQEAIRLGGFKAIKLPGFLASQLSSYEQSATSDLLDI
jgi:hypothetical protein